MWFGRLAVLLALFSLSGLDRAFVQTYAWVTMMQDRTPAMGFDSALEETFSGKHPCEVCLALLENTQERQRQAPAPDQPDQGPRLFATTGSPSSLNLSAPSDSRALPDSPAWAFDSVIHDLPTPPPRRV